MTRYISSLLFWLCLTCKGATYYVDYVGGNDANNGTSTGTAWKHIPGDPSATGTPAGISGVTGTIYLKGGTLYNLATSSGILIDHSHYTGAGPLLIANGTAVSWGSGIPAIDGAGIGNWILQTSSMTNVTIRGLEMRNTVAAPAPGTTGVTLGDSVSNVLDSCVLHDFGTNTTTRTDAVGPYNANGPYPTYHTITNCNIYNVTQKAIEPYRAGYNTIVSNFIHDVADHGIVCTSIGNHVYGNTFSNISVNIWLVGPTQPGFGIKAATGGGGTPISCDSNWIYNNVFEHCFQGGVNIDAAEENLAIVGTVIANNTFIDIDVTGGYGAAIRCDTRGGAAAKVSGSLIVNNILTTQALASNDGGSPQAQTTPISIFMPAFGSFMGDNNLIAYNLTFGYNAITFPGIKIGGNEFAPSWFNFCDTGSTSPDYRFKVTANGTGNSCPYGNQFFNVDPQFVQYPNNLNLGTSSPVKFAGTNLSSLFTTDITGRTRTSWSMGAFDFISGSPPVTTPISALLILSGP